MLHKWRSISALPQDALITCWVVKKVDVIKSDARDQVCCGVQGENQLQHTWKKLELSLAENQHALQSPFMPGTCRHGTTNEYGQGKYGRLHHHLLHVSCVLRRHPDLTAGPLQSHQHCRKNHRRMHCEP